MNVSHEQWSIRRGDIYRIELGVDQEYRRLERPVLVVQNDIGNRLCSSVIVVPLTPEKEARRVLFGILIAGGKETGLERDYVALFSQIRTLDKARFAGDNYRGFITPKLRREVNEALEISLGLSALQEIEDRMRHR
ncbi:type II toxin-antitoxin system PemK/MazF family toxin [Metallumcola ferriviriculae]|uniref:mRNA interferase n=1 Tax=Metallumcola ferriviriculae TaxID=3039180 RepID=A0AAU0URL6_9FIRM|nr:type II toxin-antitoxin system PemK/MazF family toxin [Desulfitibacteraceae bacterium MK1]